VGTLGCQVLQCGNGKWNTGVSGVTVWQWQIVHGLPRGVRIGSGCVTK